MSGKYVEVDVEEFRQFFERVGKAARGDFKKELELFLEGVGNEFLRMVQNEIIRRKILDTRLLLASFQKGAEGCVWEIGNGGLTLEVGSSVKYAKFVNDGHWTNPKGVEQRFVPGDVELGPDGKIVKFTYNPSANTGMVLKQHWVDANPYFDSTLRDLNRIFPGMLEEKMQEWIESYFGG